MVTEQLPVKKKEDFIMRDINAKVGGVTPSLQPTNPAYNTYVGARYVPIFAGTPGSEWTDTVAYEPLTIVIHEGNSYTSKTFVPVGVDIGNEEYWALTGNYNAQVELYRQEVSSLKTLYNSLSSGKPVPATASVGGAQINYYKDILHLQKVMLSASRQFTSDNYIIQGGCFNGSNYIIALNLNGSTDECKFITLNQNFNVISESTVYHYGHINDMEYNPNTGHYYLATAQGTMYPNSIVEVSNTFAFIASHRISSEGTTGVCLDKANNLFYVLCYTKIYICDPNFNIISSFTIDPQNYFIGCVSYNGYILYGYWDGLYTKITKITPENERYEFTIMQYGESDEPENLILNGDKIYILSGQVITNICYLSLTNSSGGVADLYNYFSQGEKIPKNSDLNTYIFPGNYYITDGSTAATISNLPATLGAGGGDLKVSLLAGGSILQELKSNTGFMFYRRKDIIANKTFTAWETYFTIKPISNALIYGSGFCTDQMKNINVGFFIPVPYPFTLTFSSITITNKNGYVLNNASPSEVIINTSVKGGAFTAVISRADGSAFNVEGNESVNVRINGANITY